MNDAKRNDIGKMARSSFSYGIVTNGLLGAFLVKDIKTGMEFSVGGGAGMTDSFRKEVWNFCIRGDGGRNNLRDCLIFIS